MPSEQIYHKQVTYIDGKNEEVNGWQLMGSNTRIKTEKMEVKDGAFRTRQRFPSIKAGLPRGRFSLEG